MKNNNSKRRKLSKKMYDSSEEDQSDYNDSKYKREFFFEPSSSFDVNLLDQYQQKKVEIDKQVLICDHITAASNHQNFLKSITGLSVHLFCQPNLAIRRVLQKAHDEDWQKSSFPSQESAMMKSFVDEARRYLDDVKSETSRNQM